MPLIDWGDMVNQIKISTRATDFSDRRAMLRLGGVTIYAANELELENAFNMVAAAIDYCSSLHLSMRRVTLSSEVKNHLNPAIDRGAFGAILGAQLKMGTLDSIPCATVTGKIFRVYVHKRQLDVFQDYLQTAAAELRRRRVVHVRDIEETLFRERGWGTWDSALHILARLVQIGRACYVDDKSFCWPVEIENAINKSLRRIRVIRAGRLAHH